MRYKFNKELVLENDEIDMLENILKIICNKKKVAGFNNFELTADDIEDCEILYKAFDGVYPEEDPRDTHIVVDTATHIR